ncbi:MAG TPA: hypothetical protein VIV63_17515 [Steroidobacteraceae bacterium]
MRIVHSLDELLELPREPGVNGYRAREPLRLEIPRLASDVSTRAQDSLNRLQERCGSLAAAGVMFLTLVAGVFKVFTRNPTLFSWQAFGELVAVLVVSFCLGAIAKMIALAVTRWQFARRCREHYEQLSRLVQGAATR